MEGLIVLRWKAGKRQNGYLLFHCFGVTVTLWGLSRRLQAPSVPAVCAFPQMVSIEGATDVTNTTPTVV